MRTWAASAAGSRLAGAVSSSRVPWLRLPDAVPAGPEIDGKLDLHRARVVVSHRVVRLVHIRQQPQPEALHVAVGLDARLVLVEANVRIEAGHAHVHARLAGFVTGIRFH